MKSAWQRALARTWLPLLLALAPCLALADDPAQAASPVVEPAELRAPVAPPAPPARSEPWYQHLAEASRVHGVDVHLLQALAQVESNFNASVISRSGAVGLMQITPVTAFAVAGLRGTRQSVRQQLQDPAINAHVGAQLVRTLMDTFSERLDLVLAAYNAGTGSVRKAGNRVPANGETPRFVKKVTALYASIKASAGAAEPAPLAAEAPAVGIWQPLIAPR